MKKAISSLVISLIPITVFAGQNVEPLPAPDLKTVPNCFLSMRDDFAKTNFRMDTLFYASQDDSMGSIESGRDGNVCYQKFEKTSLCRIVHKSNDGSWVKLNNYIIPKFSKEASDNLNLEVKNFNDDKKLIGVRYYSITCKWSCKNKVNVTKDCKGSLVSST